MSACVTCGGDPCVNPSFCAACRDADQRKARGERPRHIDPSMWSRRPADAVDYDSMSLEQLWDLFNRQRRTPQTTIEAIMHSVRERGVAALDERANRERLAHCDEAALEQIDNRIARLTTKEINK